MRDRTRRPLTTRLNGRTFRSDEGWEVSKVYDMDTGVRVGTIEQPGRGNQVIAKSGKRIMQVDNRQDAIDLIAAWADKMDQDIAALEAGR